MKVEPYEARNDLTSAARSLVAFGRPLEAVRCLANQLQREHIDIQLAIQALRSIANSPKAPEGWGAEDIPDIIKVIQGSDGVQEDDLLSIEWAFLSYLGGHHHVKPVTLERRLSTNADFFCEAIRLVFRSSKEGENPEDVPEREQRLAGNVYDLLHKWTIPPGLRSDDTFDPSAFTAWLERVKVLCTESGHLEVAYSVIGQVLIYAPADLDGFWLHRSVAEILNGKDTTEMRDGYRVAQFNRRGAYVWTEWKQEANLTKYWRTRAEETELQGFPRLAVTLRELADSFEASGKWRPSRDPFED